jgi:hypothetical protein
MTMAYQVKSHPVEVARIQSIQPLMGRNTVLMSPDFGLTLILYGGAKTDWLSEKGNPAPKVDDYFVCDDELHVSYIVAAEKFNELFSNQEIQKKEENSIE